MKWTDSDKAFIETQRVAHMATSNATGEPHVVPVCFVFDGVAFYTAVDQKRKSVPPGRLRRLQNLGQNPRVAPMLDDYHEDWTRLRYLLVRGRASVVKDEAERDRAFRLLEAKHVQYREGRLRDSSWPLVRVDPERVHRWRATGNPANTSERDPLRSGESLP